MVLSGEYTRAVMAEVCPLISFTRDPEPRSHRHTTPLSPEGGEHRHMGAMPLEGGEHRHMGTMPLEGGEHRHMGNMPLEGGEHRHMGAVPLEGGEHRYMELCTVCLLQHQHKSHHTHSPPEARNFPLGEKERQLTADC